MNADGREIAQVPLWAPAWALAPDADLAVVALGDGTVRWYALTPDAMRDELSAVFLADDGLRRAAWRRGGVSPTPLQGGGSGAATRSTERG